MEVSVSIIFAGDGRDFCSDLCALNEGAKKGDS